MLSRHSLSAAIAAVLHAALVLNASAQQATEPPFVRVVEQSSPPAAPDAAPRWDDVVDHLSQLLANGDAPGVARAVSDSTPIVSFARPRVAGISSLLSETTGRFLASSRAYDTTPSTIATNIAADLQSADQLPADVRKVMVLESEDQASRANTTAAQWVRSVLAAKETDPIAVLVFYNAQTPNAPPRARFTFVLIKGEKRPDGACHFTKISFGNPTEGS